MTALRLIGWIGSTPKGVTEVTNQADAEIIARRWIEGRGCDRVEVVSVHTIHRLTDFGGQSE